MAGGYPMGWDVCAGASAGQTSTGTNPGTTLTSSGSANTKGSWVQLVASTTQDISFVQVTLTLLSGSVGLVDIGVGSAGNEVVVVNNLVVPEQFIPSVISFPLTIPSGTRISARTQAATGSSTHGIAIVYYDSAYTEMEGVAGIDSLGTNLAASVGTSVANGQPGAYTQLIASTARDYQGIFSLIDFLNKGGTGTNLAITLDIGIGAAASEIAIVPTAQIVSYSGSFAYPGQPVLYTPILVPAGTRISARATSGSGVQTMGVTVYGAYL